MTCSLSACQYLMPFINGDGQGDYSYISPTESSSEQQSSESSSSTSSDHSSSSTSSSVSSSTSSIASSIATSSSTSSSLSSSSSSSTPDVPTITAKKASYTYMDYVQNNSNPLSSTPCVGSANLLVIPVWFKDSTSYITTGNKENVRSDIEKSYFGTNSETGWRSVKTFYEEESHGELTLTGKVSSWYECNSNMSYYGNDNSTVDKTRNLVKSATTWYFSNNPSDSRTNYDKDGDGYLDGVMLIYAAPDNGNSSVGSYSNLWAYCYWVFEESLNSTTNPGPNAFFWASYDFMYGSSTALSRSGKSFNGGDTNHCALDAHTYIHEMGHMFGLEDYYDYSKQYKPGGGFSMQDYNVGAHDAYSAYALGWAKAYIPTESVTIKLKPFTDSGELILLSPSFNSYNSPFDEYILLEYYTPLGLNQFDATYRYGGNMSQYPKGPSERGIRLWHIDARLAYPTSAGRYSLTTTPKNRNGVTHAMSNTYDNGSSDVQGYLSPLGSSYYNYNIMQLIRNNTSATYKPTDSLETASLFRDGSEFTMSKYKSQFVKSGKLNSNVDLGFSFKVSNTTFDDITITITKL